MTQHLNLTRNDAEQRYELHHGGELIGRIDYRLDGNVVDMYHTEVDPAHGGQGYGHLIVKFALTDAQDTGMRVRPTCPFIAKFLDRSETFRELRA